MALAKEGYSSAIRGTTKAKVAIDSNGNIVATGGTVAGQKSISFNIANAENSAEDNKELFTFFLGLLKVDTDTVVDQSTNQMQVTWSI